MSPKSIYVVGYGNSGNHGASMLLAVEVELIEILIKRWEGLKGVSVSDPNGSENLHLPSPAHLTLGLILIQTWSSDPLLHSSGTEPSIA